MTYVLKQITDKVQLKELFEYSWNSDNRPLQTNTLQLMNAIAKHSNNKERQRIIVEEMSSAYIREKIFNCIASPKNTINDDLARELYIYQTLFLRYFYYLQKWFSTQINVLLASFTKKIYSQQ